MSGPAPQFRSLTSLPDNGSPAAATTAPPSASTAPAAHSSSRILVSPRQKGNPILTYLRAVGWEFTSPSTPADYVLGAHACALFLSLRYHKLHPEYVYARMRALGRATFRLRILLVIVDIDAPDEPVRSLNHTCVLGELTLVLAWSAAEAARYIELYKSLEHSNPVGVVFKQPAGAGRRAATSFGAAVAGQDAAAAAGQDSYGAQVVDFVTTPRSINRTDAVNIVTGFGSVRGAVNASADQLGQLAGWGPTKLRRWAATMREPFRRGSVTAKAAVLGPVSIEDDDDGDDGAGPGSGDGASEEEQEEEDDLDDGPAVSVAASEKQKEVADGQLQRSMRPAKLAESTEPAEHQGQDSSNQTSSEPTTRKRPLSVSTREQEPGRPDGSSRLKKDEKLDDGIAAALAKLRGE